MEIDRYHALCELCWEALGVKISDGKHISEHIRELRQERDFYMVQSNKYYQQLLQSDGYIFWLGGECPVPDGTKLEIIYRNGDTTICRAGFDHECNDWRIGDHPEPFSPLDIIAYRVLEEAENV